MRLGEHNTRAKRATHRKNRRDWKGPATRGPYGVQSFTRFGMNCVYGNDFTMKARQVRHLHRLLGSNNPEISYYMCAMNKTFTSPTQRMATLPAARTKCGQLVVMVALPSVPFINQT